MSTNDAVIQATYADAIYRATRSEMARDERVFVLGQGVDDPKGTLGTTANLHVEFGPDRCFDTPVAEDGVLGMAIGAALAGMRPIHVHIRVDFMLLCMNQLINMAAKTHYMFGGTAHVPLVVRAAVGRSWGQGAQHSQALHSFFMHTPGLRVAAPALARDAQGALIAAIRDDNPVVFMEHRMLYGLTDDVPQTPVAGTVGKARIVAPGDDVTIVGISHMVIEALRAKKHLEQKGIDAEVIDPVWLSPLDIETIAKSVEKTGHLLVVDNGWTSCGASAEIAMSALEMLPGRAIRVDRMGFAPTPCPTTRSLEDHFYPNSRTIASKVFHMMRPEASEWVPEGEAAAEIANFKGPF